MKRITLRAVAGLGIAAAMLFGILGASVVLPTPAGAVTHQAVASPATTSVVVQTKAELAANGTTLPQTYIDQLETTYQALTRAFAVSGADRADACTPATIAYWDEGGCGFVETTGDPYVFYSENATSYGAAGFTLIEVKPLT